jgi:glycosyltransferase involved in cell wall biosynthesis
MTPIVSAIIDAYNQERFIEQAIVSVLEQNFPPAEMQIIVVDDGSTDRTPEIVRKFEPRVRLLRKPNGGQASAFNAAIAEVNADLVAFLDGDDWWAKEKIRTVVEAFDKNPGVAAVGHGYFEVLEDAPTGEMLVVNKPIFVDLSSVDAARVADPARMMLGTSRLAARRELLRRIGPIPDELVFCADTPIFMLALALGGALILDQPLCYYRLHSPATTTALAQGHFAHDYNYRFVKARDYENVKFLLAHLPPRLRELGVAPEVIAALFESDRVELQRYELQRDGGGRWQTLHAEMRAFRSAYKDATLGYKVFHGFLGALALLLGPKRFYQLRHWYSKRTGLHRLRGALGTAEPTLPLDLFQRRPVPKE